MIRSAKADLDFVPDVVAVTQRKGRGVARLLNLAIVGFFIAAVYWAHTSEIDEVTRGAARIIPSGRVQTVEHLEGGIVDAIRVGEGDRVVAGDVLLGVNPVAAETEFGESEQQRLALQAEIARLDAELNDRPFAVPAKVREKAPEIGQAQLETYQSRQQQRQAETAVLASRLSQRRQEIAELGARQQRLRRNIKLTDEEIAITKPLVEDGVMSRLNLIALERQLSDLQGEAKEVALAVRRATQASEEVERQMAERDFTFQATVANSLAGARAQLNVLNETARAEQERVFRTDIRAPVNGIVKTLHVNTIGAVIQPGAPLLDIVPVDQDLKIEARIDPKDIGFLKPDAAATVKLTAYDFTLYGGIDAVVEEISADSFQDKQGALFYRVLLKADAESFHHQGEPLALIPGMTGTVEILGNRRTILDYLLTPVLTVTGSAFGER